VAVRGVADEGKIVYVAGNYISHGIRARASDLVTRELGRQLCHLTHQADE
jgi:hypothetical protein